MNKIGDSKPCRCGCGGRVYRTKRGQRDFDRRQFASRACAHGPNGQVRSGNPNGFADAAAAARAKHALAAAARDGGRPALGMTAEDRLDFRRRLGFADEPLTTPGGRR